MFDSEKLVPEITQKNVKVTKTNADSIFEEAHQICIKEYNQFKGDKDKI